MSSNAATRVFATPELLEQILLDLATATNEDQQTEYSPDHPSTPILAVTRLSRAFQDTIKGSPNLQRLIHRLPSLQSLKEVSRNVESTLELDDIKFDHGFKVWDALNDVTTFWPDTLCGSWRKIVFLGDWEGFPIYIKFHNVTLLVKPGETCGQVFDKLESRQSDLEEHRRFWFEQARRSR